MFKNTSRVCNTLVKANDAVDTVDTQHIFFNRGLAASLSHSSKKKKKLLRSWELAFSLCDNALLKQ